MNQLASGTSTTLRRELKIISGIAWVTAGAIALLWFAVIIPLLVEHHRRKPAGEQMPPQALYGLLFFCGIILSLWVLMIFYVNADAGRRQMNRLLWTLLVIFIPNAIGFIIYFLLRKPIGQPCPKCRALIRPDFSFCPACGAPASPSCPACHHQIEAGWTNCPYCGSKLIGE